MTQAEINGMQMRRSNENVDKEQFRQDSQEVLKTYNSLDEDGKMAFRRVLINAMIKQLKPNLPANIDKMTTLTNVATDGNKNVSFSYDLTEEGAQNLTGSRGAGIKDIMQELAKVKICYNEQMKILVDLDIGINFKYMSQGRNLHEVYVDKSSCKK